MTQEHVHVLSPAEHKVTFEGKNKRELRMPVTNEQDFMQQLRSAQGLIVEVRIEADEVLKLTLKDESDQSWLRLNVFSELGHIAKIMAAKDQTWLSPNKLSSLDKEILLSEYLGKGLSTIIQSIYFTYAALLGYQQVEGAIRPENIPSVQSRYSSKHIFSGIPFKTEKAGHFHYLTYLN